MPPCLIQTPCPTYYRSTRIESSLAIPTFDRFGAEAWRLANRQSTPPRLRPKLRSPIGRHMRGVNPPVRNKNRDQQTGTSLFPVFLVESDGSHYRAAKSTPPACAVPAPSRARLRRETPPIPNLSQQAWFWQLRYSGITYDARSTGVARDCSQYDPTNSILLHQRSEPETDVRGKFAPGVIQRVNLPIGPTSQSFSSLLHSHPTRGHLWKGGEIGHQELSRCLFMI